MTGIDLIGINFKETKTKGRLIESWGNWITDHTFLMLPIGATFIIGAKANTYWSNSSINHTKEVIFFALFILSILITLYTIVKIYLNKRFISIKTNLSKKESRQCINDLIEQQGWISLKNNQDYAVAGYPKVFITGQEIIILFREREVLVNIRLAAGIKGRFPFSFGRNKRTLEKIEQKVKIPSITTQNRQLHRQS
ncbi:hypothetical protein GXP67_25805 [Rhodocytophaga rosea]|uniref:Uncharacterized protein n=1 Tax=Rhodocytophaga rosea TaxID=2704465 RepID=A0A6C0GPI4_9BACT|nr:hypothetical protein [Rhodocytophaga rosea]QHT69817.1 hypothetical protein GXP67_25805 [Rhodocytophaga rosea]